MGDSVAIANEHGELRLFTPGGEEIAGIKGPERWPEEYGLYQPDQETLYPARETPLAKAMRGESVTGVEVYIRSPRSAEGRWGSVTARPIIDDTGTPRGGVAVFTDITSLKCAQEAAEVASRTKDHFLAMLSHELRTPLTPVFTVLDELEDGVEYGKKESLEVMRRNIELERRLIDDLLDMTRVSNSRLQVQLRAVNVHELIPQVLEICDAQLSSRAMHVELELAAENAWVSADAARIQQVIWNIVQNAARFTQEGGRLEIRSFNPDRKQLMLRFSDNGIGIDPADLERVFKPFEQAERKFKQGYGGLGLGLAIAKELMEAQGGFISVESKGRGTGTTFTLTLQTTEPQWRGPEEPIREPPAPPGKLRILLVEDHTDTRSTLERVLVKKGYDVVGVGDVHSALDADAHGRFDVLVSDIGLPDGTGIDLLETIRRRHPIDAIAMSGYGMEGDIANSYKAGFATHLVKPVELKKLVSAIGQIAVGTH
jgi:signal transduction histidine kinase/CheY-like chemotaxis protein